MVYNGIYQTKEVAVKVNKIVCITFDSVAIHILNQAKAVSAIILS